MASKKNRSTSWDAVAQWYDGWMGQKGSFHHQELAIPALLGLLEVQADEQIVDVGCGQGVLATAVSTQHAHYTGVDLSPKLLRLAQKRHGRLPRVRFVQANATKLHQHPEIRAGTVDAVTFLLSIQDMEPLDKVLQAASQLLRPNGRLVMLLTHPCFRVPRQSGWGWDSQRKLRYRRIDRYLTELPVPMKQHRNGCTRSYHRPLQAYVNSLGDAGLVIDQIREIPPGDALSSDQRPKAERLADAEIPLFLGIRAVKRVKDEG